MKIGLGTVQFGTNYGVSNVHGKTAPREVESILQMAAENQIRLLDTACTYGDSESVLGRAMISVGVRFDIVTKTPVFPGVEVRKADARMVAESLKRSLEHLRLPRVYGLLAHRARDLTSAGGRHIIDELLSIRNDGLAERVGVSVYSGAEIDSVLRLFTPDIIQLPLNVLDRRLIGSGHLQRLVGSGVEVHARSVFLQGLLLMNPEQFPARLRPLRRPVEEFSRTAAQKGLSGMHAALKFVLDRPEVAKVLVGVTSAEQLRDVLAAVAILPNRHIELEPMTIDDERLLDPSTWNAGH